MVTKPRIIPPDEARAALEAQAMRGAAFNQFTLHLLHTAAVLGEQREAVLALHQPQQDQPGSLVSNSYCSCGAREVKVMEDGYASIVPAAYPCPTARALGVE